MSSFLPLNSSRISFHPIFFLLFTYMAGLIAGLYWHPPAIIILVIILLFLAAGIFFLIKNRLVLPNALFSLGLFLVATLSINHQLHPDFPSHHIFFWAHNRPVKVEGFFYHPPEFLPHKTRLYVKAQWVWVRGERFPVTGNLLLTIKECRKKFLLHDRVIFSTRLRKPRNFGNPDGFNYVRWLAFQNIYVTGYVSRDQNLALIGARKNLSCLRKVDGFRSHIRETIDRKISPPVNFLLRALILGERKVIPEEIREVFNRSGTAHILAISGLHVGIVAAFSFFLLRRLLGLSEFLLLVGNVPKLSTSLALLPILFYSLIAGAGVSVQRAFIMVATYILALLFNRERALYNALALAALVILVIQPSSLFGASFQLSFISVLGILFFSPRILSLLPKKDKLLQRLEPPLWKKAKHNITLFIVVSFSAIIATGPLVAYHFNRVSLSGLMANLIIVPLVGFFVVPLGLSGGILTPLSSSLTGLFFHVAAFILNFVLIAANFFAALPWTNFLIATPLLSEVLLFYVSCLFLFLWKFSGLPRKFVFLSLLLGILTSCYWHLHFQPRGFQVTFIDVGQGDAALLRFPKGETMLIDGGGFYNHSFDTGKNVIAPLLLRNKIRRIDYLVMSHPHPDHFDGLRHIAKNFSVREFWSNGDSIEDSYFEQLQKTLAQKDILVRTLNGNSPSMIIQGVRVDVLHPPPSYFPANHDLNTHLNNRSLVIKFSYGDIKYLFTGDIHSSAEARLLATGKDLSADVLKIPHHGSSTSSSPAFLHAVNPRIAVCSVGYNNRFGLPHFQIINRFQEESCIFCRTDLDGAITVTTDGNTVEVRCGREKSERGGLF